MNDRPIPQHFKFCPSCGRAGLGRADGKENSVQCASCGFTLFFNPYSAAGALIADPEGRILAIERARDPARGKLGVPGGFLDSTESLEQALIREVEEEVNLRVSSATFLASFPNQYRYKSVVYDTIDSYFVAKVESFDQLRAEASEVAGLRFVDPRSTPEDDWAFPSLRAAIRRYVQQLG